MMTALKTALVVLVAIISVALAEAGMIVWLGLSDELFDVTGSIWLRAIVPVVLLVVSLQTLALWRIYRQNPLRYGLIYGSLYPLVHAFLLNQFFNPPADIAMYALTDMALAAIVIGGCYHLFWKDSPKRQSDHLADQAAAAE